MSKKVWVYENGDTFERFDSEDEARTWFEINDPEGVAFAVVLGDLRPPDEEG